MSSDFNINREQAETAGVTLTENRLFGFQYDARFPGYAFTRDVGISSDGKEILLACSGQFRLWLTNFLKESEIEYSVYPED